jgi:hypothetical protein
VRAYAVVGSWQLEMSLISVSEMDELRADRKRASLEGLPVFFDKRKRTWPLLADGVSVLWKEEAP